MRLPLSTLYAIYDVKQPFDSSPLAYERALSPIDAVSDFAQRTGLKAGDLMAISTRMQ